MKKKSGMHICDVIEHKNQKKTRKIAKKIIRDIKKIALNINANIAENGGKWQMNSNRPNQLEMLQTLKKKNESEKQSINQHVTAAYYASFGTLARMINVAEDKTNEKNKID